MILALLSDIHANHEALGACLRHAHERGASQFAFLGDFIGYGGEPEAVVATVMRYASDGAIVIKGNHDEALETRRAPFYMNEAARQAIDWARRSLTDEQKAFLAALPLCVRRGRICFVHASAATPQRWEYIDSPSAALKSLNAAGEIYTFSGHVHEQVLYAQTGAKKATEFRPHSGSAVPLGAQRRWLALVGSVGQPRDGRPAAGYALFDQDQDELTYFRVPYDHLSAARKIRAAGLSEGLAYRVEKGV